MPIPATAFATDEDVAIRAGDDFARIVSLDITIAAGNDGAFLTADRWTLTSASADFAAQGVAPGMVALIAIPKQIGMSNNIQAMAVQSVATGAMTLRRKGMAATAGQPPGPATGSPGVQFTVPTLTPQLLLATYEIDRRYGIDEQVMGRRTADLYDPVELRFATVLTVLWKLYQTAAQQGSADAKEGANAALWAKAKSAKAELDEVLDRLALQWQSLTSIGLSPSPTVRTMRIGR